MHLDIDDTQPVDKAYWFKYSTFYATWYCMPELGDYVNTYFPANNEIEGIIINSIKQSVPSGFARERTTAAQQSSSSSPAPSEKSANLPVDFETLANDEKVKMLVTEQGKMIILDDRRGRVTILCNGGTYITLTDGGGISIITNLDVLIDAQENITLDSKKVIYLQAEEEIKLECGESNITINPDEIIAKATDIYLNH